MKDSANIKGLKVAESTEEQLIILNNLGQKAFDIHNTLPFKGEDVRLWIYKTIWGAVIVYSTQLRLCNYGNENERDFLRIVGAENRERGLEHMKGLLRSAKLTFNLECQFGIETGLNCILKALDPSDKTGGFKDISRKVLGMCDVRDPDKKADILYVPALMRNTLHNAGVHGKQSYKPITIAGVTYDFNKGESVECISVESIVHAYTYGLDILTEIVRSAASLKCNSLLDPMKKYRVEQAAKAAPTADKPTTP